MPPTLQMPGAYRHKQASRALSDPGVPVSLRPRFAIKPVARLILVPSNCVERYLGSGHRFGAGIEIDRKAGCFPSANACYKAVSGHIGPLHRHQCARNNSSQPGMASQQVFQAGSARHLPLPLSQESVVFDSRSVQQFCGRLSSRRHSGFQEHRWRRSSASTMPSPTNLGLLP